MPKPSICDRHPEAKPCWLYDNDERYKAHWDNPQTVEIRPECKEPIGDYLAQSIEWLGMVQTGSCGCKHLQSRMNAGGIAWCRANYETILSRLQNAAFSMNMPLPMASFVPLLELAIWRAAMKSVLMPAVSDHPGNQKE